MQRLNRSTHAPLGTAFFLFLGLAILPFSLRAAGVQVSFTPRLSAAMDAWQQIAEVFGASYQPGTGADLSVVRDSDSDDSKPIDSLVVPHPEFACAGEMEDLGATVRDLSEALAVKPAPGRCAFARSGLRRSPAVNRVAMVVAARTIKASCENHAPAIRALGALKLAMLKREGLVMRIDKQVFKQAFELVGDVRSLQDPKSMRVLVRMRRAAAGSARTAECKVFSALASARKRECDRAMLTGMTNASPDNSEF